MTMSSRDFRRDFRPTSALQAAGSAAAGTGRRRWPPGGSFGVLRSEDLQQGIEWRYDVSRINELRRMDLFYRLFQPAIQLLGPAEPQAVRRQPAGDSREIQAAGLPRFWLAEEYLGKVELIALLPVAGLRLRVFSTGSAPAACCWPLLAVVATAWLLRRRLAGRAHWRLRQIKRRMPFLLDLLTLLMEAGSTFLGALRQAVEEFEGHPVAQEFGRVLADMNLGKTRTEAFAGHARPPGRRRNHQHHRLDPARRELGTPLASIFRTQADVLRIKRTQRAELLAGEAGVNMLLPAVLVMVATVLIIIGPFLLNYLYFGLSL